jgi:hypothetical protein
MPVATKVHRSRTANSSQGFATAAGVVKSHRISRTMFQLGHQHPWRRARDWSALSLTSETGALDRLGRRCQYRSFAHSVGSNRIWPEAVGPLSKNGALKQTFVLAQLAGSGCPSLGDRANIFGEPGMHGGSLLTGRHRPDLSMTRIRGRQVEVKRRAAPWGTDAP